MVQTDADGGDARSGGFDAPCSTGVRYGHDVITQGRMRPGFLADLLISWTFRHDSLGSWRIRTPVGHSGTTLSMRMTTCVLGRTMVA
jgi:hypothetical protein